MRFDISNLRQNKKKVSSSFVKEARKIAKELCYDQEILDLIDNAKTEDEVIRALTTGRRRMKDLHKHGENDQTNE